MDEIEKIEKVVTKSVRELTKQVTRNIQMAAVLGYSGNIIAARIMSAKTNVERNEAINESELVAKEAREQIKKWEKEWEESPL